MREGGARARVVESAGRGGCEEVCGRRETALRGGARDHDPQEVCGGQAEGGVRQVALADLVCDVQQIYAGLYLLSKPLHSQVVESSREGAM